MNTDTTTRYRQLSTQEFASLGTPVIAYVKPLTQDGVIGYGVFAANGQQMAVLGDRDLAFAAARQHDLEPLSVH